MKLIITFIILFFIGCCSLETNKLYSQVKIQFTSKEQIKDLAISGLIFDHSVYKRNKRGFTLTVILDDNELDILSKSELEFKILVKDLIKEYNKRIEHN